MDKQDWAPEPIEPYHDVDSGLNTKEYTIFIADDYMHSGDPNRERRLRATLDRLAACYNACAGIPMEELKHIKAAYNLLLQTPDDPGHRGGR